MKILIADDDAMTRVALRKNLQKWGYEVVQTKDGAEAWDALMADNPPRLAILDWMMPKIEGIDICKRLSSNPEFPLIYTILLTGKTDKDDIVQALDNGAYDFLSKPVHTAELRSRIAVGVRLIEAEDRLREYGVQMEHLAITDYLTGACNRRFFLEHADKEIDRAKRYQTDLSFLLMDIDHFKQVNDTYGHLAGDAVLKTLVTHCKTILRDSDMFARFGGEEFAALMPETDGPGALDLAERLRKCLADNTVEFSGQSIHFTVSIGITPMQESDHSIDAILQRADEALYNAKENGRNQTVIG